MFRSVTSTNCVQTVLKCTCLHNVIRTNRCKHIVMATSLSIMLIFFVLIGWPDSSESDSLLFTSGGAGLNSSDSKLEIKPSNSKFFTSADMAAAFPDVTPRDEYPANFFECFPDQILKLLNSREDLQRYRKCKRIVYNRVPKCGSRTILRVIKVLSKQLNYSLISNARYESLNFFRNISKLIDFGYQFSLLEEPLIYSQHIHYVNFTQLGIPPPLYINVVREPVERVISHFFYRQYGSNSDPVKSKSNQTLLECVQSGGTCLPAHQLLPFFCGQNKECRRTSRTTLQKAKRTLRSAYLVVGLTEDLPAFLDTLELLLPDFFANAPQVFQELESGLKNETRTVQKPHVDAETRQAIKDLLPLEYEFYEYAKQRFYTLHERVLTLGDWRRRRRGSGVDPLTDKAGHRNKAQLRKARKQERNRSKKLYYHT